MTAVAQEQTRPRGLGGEYSFTEKEWEAGRGLHRSVTYADDGTITFTYADATPRKMTLQAFEAFVRARLADQTVVQAAPPALPMPRLASGEPPAPAKLSDAIVVSITYYQADGVAMRTLGRGNPARVSWSLHNAPGEQAGRRVVIPMLCFHRPQEASRPADGSCIEAYELLIRAHSRRNGDAFEMLSGKSPPDFTSVAVLFQGAQLSWPDGQPLLPARAPLE